MPESVTLKVSQKKISAKQQRGKKIETDQQRPVWWYQTFEHDFNTCIIGIPGGEEQERDKSFLQNYLNTKLDENYLQIQEL